MDEKINATSVIHTREDKKRTSLIDVFNVAEITETLKALQGEREDDLKEIHRSWIDNAVYDILKENKYAPYDILDVDFEQYSFIDSTVVSASLNDLTASIVFGITKEGVTIPNQETLEPAGLLPFELIGVTGGNALCCAGDTTGQLLVLFSNQALLLDFNGEGSIKIYTIPQENYIGVAYAGGSWVAITSDGKIYRSVNNGENWDLVTTFQVGFTDITSNGTNTFFAVSNSGNSYFSTDNGVTWTLKTMRDHQWSGIGYFEELETYIACSIDGGRISIWDKENAEWAFVGIFNMEMRAIACSKDVVVIVSKGDKCIASYDGINWETVKIPNATWTTISRDKDFFYVFSEDGKVARSATGGITGIMFASLDEVDKGEEVGKSIAPNVLKQVTDRYLLLAGGEMTGTLVSQNIELKGNISSNKEETTITMFQPDGKQTSEIKTSGTDNRLFQITQVNADDTISMIELNGETGKINIINDLDVAGNTEVGNDLTVNGNITAGNDLTVTGNITAESDLNVNGNLTVSGSTTLNGNLFAGGSENTIGGSKTTIDSDTVEINSPTTVNSNLTVENDLTVGNDLTVEGTSTLDKLVFDTDTDIITVKSPALDNSPIVISTTSDVTEGRKLTTKIVAPDGDYPTTLDLKTNELRLTTYGANDSTQEIPLGQEASLKVITSAQGGGAQGYFGSLWFGQIENNTDMSPIYDKSAGIAGYNPLDIDQANQEGAQGELHFFTKKHNEAGNKLSMKIRHYDTVINNTLILTNDLEGGAIFLDPNNTSWTDETSKKGINIDRYKNDELRIFTGAPVVHYASMRQGLIKLYQNTTIHGNLTVTGKLEATFTLPIGFVYIQFRGQSAPADLFPNTTWTNISATYAGRFFRAEGGGANSFGGQQGGGLPNITGHFAFRTAQNAHMQANASGACYPSNWIAIAFPDGGGDVTGGGNPDVILDASRSSALYGATTEVRPTNETVRIWKRTA